MFVNKLNRNIHCFTHKIPLWKIGMFLVFLIIIWSTDFCVCEQAFALWENYLKKLTAACGTGAESEIQINKYD